MVTQNEFATHDCGTPLGDGCNTCVEWFEQGNHGLKGEALEFAIETLGVPCKTRNCIHGGKVDPQYTENQIGSRCQGCLDYIRK